MTTRALSISPYIWVYCGHETCFAPAAGEFKKGQCWLKYQAGQCF